MTSNYSDRPKLPLLNERSQTFKIQDTQTAEDQLRSTRSINVFQSFKLCLAPQHKPLAKQLTAHSLPIIARWQAEPQHNDVWEKLSRALSQPKKPHVSVVSN